MAAPSVQPKVYVEVPGAVRAKLVSSLTGSDVFALGVRKCPCVNYMQLVVFPKTFLKFKHLSDLYPEHVLYFDAGATLPVPIEMWSERLVAATLSDLNIRPCTEVDDILCYRLFLCCSQADQCPNKTPPVAATQPTQPSTVLQQTQ